MKRVLALILTFTLILSCLAGVLAETAPEGDSGAAAEVAGESAEASGEETETAAEVPAEEEGGASGKETEETGNTNPYAEPSENLRIIGALLNSEDFRHLLEIDDVKYLISDLLAESVIWMLQNRPVTMKILAELGAGENDLKIINRLWDSETVIERSVADYLAEPDGLLLQEEAIQVFGSSDFLQSVKDFSSLATSEDLQNLIQAFTGAEPEAEAGEESAETAGEASEGTGERAGEGISEPTGTESPESTGERAGEGISEAAGTDAPENTVERAGEESEERAGEETGENPGEATGEETPESADEETTDETESLSGEGTGETAEAGSEEPTGKTTETENDPFLKDLAEHEGWDPEDERFLRVKRLYELILHSDWAQHSLPTLLKNKSVWHFSYHLLSLVDEPKLQPARQELIDLSQDKDLCGYIISFVRANVKPYLNLLTNNHPEDIGIAEAPSENSVPEASETNTSETNASETETSETDASESETSETEQP